MIIVPELETIVLLTPRTGSASLRRAVAKRWPGSFLLHRHMEADGCPQGYDHWPKIGVVRDPVERLWSLYKFMRTYDAAERYSKEFRTAMRLGVARPFEDWLLNNETVFCTPWDSGVGLKLWPLYTTRWPLPENRKSQWIYLRPDLGTVCYRYRCEIAYLAARLDIDIADLRAFNENVTPKEDMPELTGRGKDHIARWFEWDLEAR